MANIRIKSRTTIETEIEVSFPLYYYHGYYFKLISEQEYMRVCCDEYEIMINHLSINHNMVQTVISQGNEIAKEKFDSVYSAALSAINQRAFMEVSEAATDQDIREQLDDENSLISQLYDYE